ncbi:TPA: restriction endonuclease subunit S [Stenotrophomonas maltophilia]|uniref:restriction endonuclease subunit S n=2 Tax=Gammaproteobacteria TaxID=1236 RepID=UPI0005B6D4A7|nr:restriction endonuclease subunit S [Stenotrophomonas maltophilia]KIS38245.1 type-1 restriction enzyme EcoDI specificity protein [Stenotrophomonas maltophilia WJ66]MBH1624060.1 restriction endonuclease subunit S [Stenotrophomonas maltophilia]MCF3460638.1 type I restriction endonuclease subunit S [Stenotrophomonas maltophilia]MCF3517551.1 type I restriction endonuclease subunit S [Stenotrophomonas maltophilia]MCU1012811.1 restriction endonuclease subunit S [Stenotrophomonas maltophilia]
MNALPKSWTETTLGAVIDYGKAEKVEPDAIADDAWILELEDIEKDTSKIISRASFGERKSKSTKNRFYNGDVLYGKLRPYLNKVVVADADGYCTTEIVPITPTEVTDSRYVFYWLKHPRFLSYVTEVSHGLNMPRLGTDTGKAAPFVLAPLSEQTRIADKLDALLAHVDAARGRLDCVPVLLKRFRQSVLTAATSGELTKEWRDGKKAEWRETDLQFVAQVGTGSTPLRANKSFYAEQGTPWITSAATSERFVISAEEFVTADAIKAHRLKVYPAGTLLVAMYGEGKTRGQVTELAIPATINQACAAVQVDEGRADRRYVRFVLEANYYAMRELAEGGNQPNLNLTKVKEFPILIPPLDEQAEIIRRAEALLAQADKVHVQYEAARSRVSKLTSALLTKAFRGELVPQDPQDEPASALLERLQAAKASAQKAMKQRRK